MAGKSDNENKYSINLSRALKGKKGGGGFTADFKIANSFGPFRPKLFANAVIPFFQKSMNHVLDMYFRFHITLDTIYHLL